MLPLKKREGIRELCGRQEQQVMMVALPWYGPSLTSMLRIFCLVGDVNRPKADLTRRRSPSGELRD